MTERYAIAYEVAKRAEEAFSEALRAEHGDAAGDKRYIPAYDTPAIRDARERFQRACEDLREALEDMRREK